MISSLVFACMAYACGVFVMICHWHGRLPGLTVDFLAFPFPGYPWSLWVYFLLVFLVGSHVSLAWVDLLVS